MFTTNKPTHDACVPCRYHGPPDPSGQEPKVPWMGAIRCGVCLRVYTCEELDGKRVYAHVPDDGFCTCGSALFPNVGAVSTGPGVFSAQPRCDACAALVWAQQNPPPETASTSP